MERGIALVTGGGTGIGAACCAELAARGFHVAIHYNKSKEKAEQLAASLPNAFTLKADISSTEELDCLVQEICAREQGLSVLVNNAGMIRDNHIYSAGVQEFEQIISTNLRAAWYLTKRFVKPMIRSKGGRIINISSVIAYGGNAGQTLYAMSKAGLDGFTRSAAKELAPYGILVNSVAPGFIDTDMTVDLPEENKQAILARVPLGRMGKPSEVAEVVAFLATAGSYCSGSVFHVNGGMYGG